MRQIVFRLGAFLGYWCLLGAATLGEEGAQGQAGQNQGSEAQRAFFERKVRPVLVKHCYQCHSAEAESVHGGLLLDTRAGIRAGGEGGPAVVPGKPDESLLLEAIRYEGYEMPPSGPLPEQVVADLERWIRMGAFDPREGQSTRPAKKPLDVAAAKTFWSFQKPSRHQPPSAEPKSWPQGRIDRFVVARFQKEQLQPTVQADRRTLIRRVTFDLIGLPPTPEEVQEFLADVSPQAYENLIERLLASPHYGERWARLWLDVARYAEDQAHIVGNNSSLFYPNAYLYRNWIIDALNQDLPYDQFIRQQLAADLIDPEDRKSHHALGFLGLGPKYYRRKAPEVMADEWEDRVDVVGRGLLGLTVACARCHDHKYDPIPTADYYSLAGVFASTEMYNRPLAQEASDQQANNGKNKRAAKKPQDAVHIVREGKVRDLPIHIRGDATTHGKVVPRRFLEILCEGPRQPFTQGSGRLELAKAIASRENPLTARVIVNRVWREYFGRGLVSTPSNFGRLGQSPSHPELLDDLAVRFMEAGWSLKWLHREITLSATYQQASSASPEVIRQDPANRWLARMTRKRLSVEAWRDAVLAVNGRLKTHIGGRSIDPADPKQTRRTVYSRISRLDLNPLLALFDFPDPNAHAGRRAQTTTPLQKLFVLNSPWMVAQAGHLVDRLHREVPASDRLTADRSTEENHRLESLRIKRAYWLLYARAPSKLESRLGLQFLTTDGWDDQASAQASAERWQAYAQALLSSNEFLFLD